MLFFVFVFNLHLVYTWRFLQTKTNGKITVTLIIEKTVIIIKKKSFFFYEKKKKVEVDINLKGNLV